MIIISAHSDTNFKKVKLQTTADSYNGYLDNYVGVYAAMKAYFSGDISFDYVRMELTYGEETGMSGAKEVAREVTNNDLVIVMDVTGTPTVKDFVVEKCKSDRVENFLRKTLKGFHFDLYKDCPDPISNMDEIEVYKKKTDNYFFLGIPCKGGDYNLKTVECSKRSIEECAKALIAICKNYKNFSN